MATWNKGPALYKNSVQNIAQVLIDNKIDLLSLQELNLKKSDNINQLKIPHYTLVHDNLLEANGLARAGFLIHDSLKYKNRADLTNQKEAHVAITLYLTKNKRINCHSLYRQWQEVNQVGKIHNTGTIAAQKTRLKKQQKCSNNPK